MSVQATLKKKKRQVEKGFNIAIREVALEVLEEAQDRVPVITGFLKNSGEVEKISEDKYAVTFTAPYAIYVHEIPRPPSSNGEYKYLRNALRVVVSRDIVVDKVRERLT